MIIVFIIKLAINRFKTSFGCCTVSTEVFTELHIMTERNI